MSTNRPKTLPSERYLFTNISASASFIIAKQFEARATTAKELRKHLAARSAKVRKRKFIDNSYSVLKVLTFEYLKEDPTEMWGLFLF